MNIPDNLSYSNEHLWTRPADDGSWFAGITDYAQDLLGDIVYIDPPAVGMQLKAGKPCGLVESVKTGSDLHALMDGVVEATNEKLQNNPELINDAPYEAWIFRFRPDKPADSGSLLDANRYRELLGS
jgi:glycine cleavage system H protein